MPAMLDDPSPIVGSAMSTPPAVPIVRPMIRPVLTRTPKASKPTTTTVTGLMPFSMPVMLDETRSSAKAKSVSGSAIQVTDSRAVVGLVSAGRRVRARGTRESTENPMAIRTHPMKAGWNDSSPTAMR